MRLEKLHKQFVGVCYRSMLITSIVRIIRSSHIRTNSKVLDGSMHMDIQFEAEGVIYEKDEIIPDAKVNHVENLMITANSEFAKINIRINNLHILKAGDVTPVIVNISQYNLYNEKIAIAAKPFLPQSKQEIMLYVLVGDYADDTQTVALNSLINEYKKFFDGLTKDQTKILDYFNDLIYPYKEIRDWTKKLQLEGQNIKKEIKPTKGMITDLATAKMAFLPTDKLKNDHVYFVNQEIDMGIVWRFDNVSDYRFVVAEISRQEFAKMMLERQIKNHYTLLKFLETYPDMATLNKSNHIWKYYNMNKL